MPKTFKFVVTADTHLRLDEKGKLADDGLPLQLHRKMQLLYNMVDYCITHNIPTIIHCGDLFERPNPSEKLRKPVIEWIQYILHHDKRIVFCAGNHDTADLIHFNLQSEPKIVNSEKFTVVTSRQLVQLTSKKHILFTAWGQEEYISEFTPSAPTLLFGHAEVIGAHYDSEIRSGKGLAPTLFRKFKHAFFGHYHKRQQTQYYTYIGATDRKTFGERDNPVGFLVIEWGSTINTIIINQKGTPYLQIEIPAEEPLHYLKEYYEIEKCDTAFVKLQVTLPKSQSHTFPTNEIERYILQNGAWYVTTDKEYIQDQMLESISRNLSEMEIFNEYVERRELSSEKITIGKGIMKTVFLGE